MSTRRRLPFIVMLAAFQVILTLPARAEYRFVRNIGAVGSGAGPTAIAADPAGDVYVGYVGAGGVNEYNGSGSLIKTFPGQFTYVDSVAVDAAGNVWATGSQGLSKFTDGMEILTSSGTVITQISQPVGTIGSVESDSRETSGR